MAVNGERVVSDLKSLGKIGYEEGIGTTRVAYSPAYVEGAAYTRMLMEDAGLTVSVDPAGNLIGRLEPSVPAEDAEAKVISIGSHVDSVPGGGIYDGCLGVMSGIECIRALKEEGYANRHPIEIISFIEEEGNAVGGTFGSKCFTGMKVEDTELKKACNYDITEEMIVSAKKSPEDYAAYLELHIEQGGILESEKLPIGVVEGIVGIARYRASVAGQANHAGTTPMNLRNDAMQKTLAMLQELYNEVSAREDGMVCTIGQLDIINPAVNVVPGRVEFLIEARGKSIEDVTAVIEEWGHRHEAEGLTLENYLEQKETLMDSQLLESLEAICEEKAIGWKRMFSGAGHDAMNMVYFTPTVMIFIPSIGGISHNRAEYSTLEDITLGTEVLYNLLKKLDRKGPVE